MVLIIKKAALLWVPCFLFPVLLLSQEQSDKSFSGWEGLPYFENFTTAEHGGGQQSWDVVQDKNGVIYIANAHGVLTYDGNRWKRISINESFHIFQIAHQKKTGRIFTGGISEIGYIEADSSGIMRYHSLLPKIDPERRSFSRIQHCFVWNDKAWFITQDEIFIWTGEQMHYIPAHTQNPVDSSSQDNASFGNYIKQNNHLYIEHSEKGLLRWAGDDFKIAEAEAFREMDSAIFLHPFQNNKILAGTINNELYLIDSTLTKATRFRTEADQFLKGNSLNTATILRDGSIALGTTEGGLAIIDSSGQWRQLINMKAGLLTNDLSGIFQAKKGAIWLVMNNGIARLEWPAVLSIFDDRLTGFGDVSSLTTYKDQLYAGTFNGLFRQQATPVSVLSDENPQEGTFQKTEMVPHTVWDLLSTDNELLAATEQGIFQLRPELNQQTKVTSGVSRRIKYARKSDGEGIDSLSVHGLLSDHYASLSYDKQEQSWEESAASHNFKGFGFSMYRSSNAVWLATFHPLIYQAKVYSGDRPVPLIQYDSTSGLPASGVYSLGFFDEKIIAGTQEGTYRFLPDESKFVPYPWFNKLIGGVMFLIISHPINVGIFGLKRVAGRMAFLTSGSIKKAMAVTADSLNPLTGCRNLRSIFFTTIRLDRP